MHLTYNYHHFNQHVLQWTGMTIQYDRKKGSWLTKTRQAVRQTYRQISNRSDI